MSRTTPRTARQVLLASTLPAALAAVLALGGCGGDADRAGSGPAPAPAPAPAGGSSAGASGAAAPTPVPTTGAEDAPPTASGSGAEAVVVPDVLRFEATTVSGDAFDGASVAGRPVVLWFWAPWCAVCKSQAPEVSELAADYGDEVAFVGVGSLSDAGEIEAFADDVPGPTHLSDPDGALYQRFGIAEQSSFVVLDAAGDEVLRTGYADDDELADVVADLAG